MTRTLCAENLGTWYFTFGVGSRHAGRFYVVHDATRDSARGRMVDAFGWDWAMQYDEKQWSKGGVTHEDTYRLKEIR